jgi:transposase
MIIFEDINLFCSWIMLGIHHSIEFIKSKFDNNIRIIYNAPYSPDLNPIENFFSVIKSHIRQSSLINNEIDIILKI